MPAASSECGAAAASTGDIDGSGAIAGGRTGESRSDATSADACGVGGAFATRAGTVGEVEVFAGTAAAEGAGGMEAVLAIRGGMAGVGVGFASTATLGARLMGSELVCTAGGFGTVRVPAQLLNALGGASTGCGGKLPTAS